MHDSVIRLLDCARKATSELPESQRITDFIGLQHRLAISSGVLTNWKKRGISKQGALAAAQVFGCTAGWLLEGAGPHWKYQQTPSEGSSSVGLAQDLSHPLYTVTPGFIAWEKLMQSPLEAEFQTVMPDASMAPEVPMGARIILVTGVEPVAGDYVLIADSTGHHYLREYKQLTPGHWQAHPCNSAFLPMDCAVHGLRVLAVYDGMRGRRSRV